MTRLTLSISPSLQNWIDDRLAGGEYADAADYVRDLVRRDRDAASDAAWVRRKIEEGLASGVVDAEPEDVLREIMARLPDA